MKNSLSLLGLLAIGMQLVAGSPAPATGLLPRALVDSYNYGCAASSECGMMPTEKKACGQGTKPTCGYVADGLVNGEHTKVGKNEQLFTLLQPPRTGDDAGFSTCDQDPEARNFWKTSDKCACVYVASSGQGETQCRLVK